MKREYLREGSKIETLAGTYIITGYHGRHNGDQLLDAFFVPDDEDALDEETMITTSDLNRLAKELDGKAHDFRWQRLPEFTVHGHEITDEDMSEIASYMDDEIRERLHSEIAPCSHDEFIYRYLKEDPDFLEILQNEFDF